MFFSKIMRMSRKFLLHRGATAMDGDRKLFEIVYRKLSGEFHPIIPESFDRFSDLDPQTRILVVASLYLEATGKNCIPYTKNYLERIESSLPMHADIHSVFIEQSEFGYVVSITDEEGAFSFIVEQPPASEEEAVNIALSVDKLLTHAAE